LLWSLRRFSRSLYRWNDAIHGSTNSSPRSTNKIRENDSRKTTPTTPTF